MIDSTQTYDSLYAGKKSSSSISGMLREVPRGQQERILKHVELMVNEKKADSSTSSPLVASLRRLYETSSPAMFRSMLELTLHQKTSSIEELLSKLCPTTPGEKTSVPSLVLAILTILTTVNAAVDVEAEPERIDLRAAKKKGGVKDKKQIPNSAEALPRPKEQHDPMIPMPSYQVGSLLYILRPEEQPSSDSEYSLDLELLAYFAQAASVHQERAEMLKKQQQQQVPSSNPEVSTTPRNLFGTGDATSSGDRALPGRMLSAMIEEHILSDPAYGARADGLNDSNDSSSSDDDDNDEVDSSSNDEHDGNPMSAFGLAGLTNELVNQAVNELLTGGMRDLDGSSDGESSPSSSSSSSNNGSDDDDDNDIPPLRPDEEPAQDSVDEDMIIRQALALSMSDPSNNRATPSTQAGPSLRVDTMQPEDDSEIADVAKELPSLPEPPAFYPYSSFVVTASEDESTQFLDPDRLDKFATLPTPHVVQHLLRYTLEQLERLKFQGESPESKTSQAIPGGMGSSLFPPQVAIGSALEGDGATIKDASTTLQMLTTLVILTIEDRNRALEQLKKALGQQKMTGDNDDGNGGGEHDQELSSPSEEGDDPAIALALNYVDEEESSNNNNSESLESKGMHRKAAAKAHDEASLLKSLQRRTDAWKEQVALFSSSAKVALKCLRTFLQYAARQSLLDADLSKSITNLRDHLPVEVSTKLSEGLLSLLEPLPSELVQLLTEELEHVCMPLDLYQEAQLAWGECIPLIHRTVQSQVGELESLLKTSSSILPSRSSENLSALPASREESDFNRLQILCRRLRVADVLDAVVAHPAFFLDDESPADGSSSALAGKPYQASRIISLIRKRSDRPHGLKGEVRRFCMALCHRMHTRVILWDGCYSLEEDMRQGPSMYTGASASLDQLRFASDGSQEFAFDPSRCSDSIAIMSGSQSPNGSSVNQRASKVWGTVMSSKCFSPKSGVHRWAIRLDKCERGHVFVGVSTSQASLKTYVGGDSNGWGMIGTQALWHARKKIRGDYGATFRTGSTIIVTLDTDAGTLSFAAWNDSTGTDMSKSFALDPTTSAFASPKARGQGGSGSLEDWGIAFEGLPLHSKLYPAVGLYQRDDRVTIIPIESGNMAAVPGSDMSSFYPNDAVLAKDDAIRSAQAVKRFNDQLASDSVEYLSNILESIESVSDDILDPVGAEILPSLAASLALVPPNIPTLSSRIALQTIPKLRSCLTKMEEYILSKESTTSSASLQKGKWIIRATGTGSSNETEEYMVDVELKVENDEVIGFSKEMESEPRASRRMVWSRSLVTWMAPCCNLWKNGRMLARKLHLRRATTRQRASFPRVSAMMGKLSKELTRISSFKVVERSLDSFKTTHRAFELLRFPHTRRARKAHVYLRRCCLWHMVIFAMHWCRVLTFQGIVEATCWSFPFCRSWYHDPLFQSSSFCFETSTIPQAKAMSLACSKAP